MNANKKVIQPKRDDLRKQLMKIENRNSIVINFTPTGMIPTKALTPNVPIHPKEIIDDVLEAYDLGITMVHLHARDPFTGAPTYKKEVYAEIIGGVRQYADDLIICVSLSGRDFKTVEQRSEPLGLQGHLKPDMGSLTLSSLNFNRQASINEPEMIQALACKMLENGIKPELEAFDSGMVNYALYLYKKRLITAPFYFNCILGNIACAQADLLHIGVMLNDLPQDSIWSLNGIGDAQLILNSTAISFGGGVRVGIEDNIWYDAKRNKLAKNIDLIKRIHLLAEANEKSIMPPKDLRKKLDLCEGNGQYGMKVH